MDQQGGGLPGIVAAGVPLGIGRTIVNDRKRKIFINPRFQGQQQEQQVCCEQVDVVVTQFISPKVLRKETIA